MHDAMYWRTHAVRAWNRRRSRTVYGLHVMLCSVSVSGVRNLVQRGTPVANDVTIGSALIRHRTLKRLSFVHRLANDRPTYCPGETRRYG